MEMLKSSRVALLCLVGAAMVMMMIPTNLAETDEGKQQWDFLSHPNSWAALASMAPLSSPSPSSPSLSSPSPPSSSAPSPSNNLPASTGTPTASPSFSPSSPPAENAASSPSYHFITVLATVSVSWVITTLVFL